MNDMENGGRVLEGEEKNNVLRQALKEQGYSESDISTMLGQGKSNKVQEKKPIKSTRVVEDTHFRDFQPWGGAKETFDIIIGEHKEDAMDNMIDEMYPNGITENELNDLLWYDKESIMDYLGIDNATYESYKPTEESTYDNPSYKKTESVEGTDETVEPEEENTSDRWDEDYVLTNARKPKKGSKKPVKKNTKKGKKCVKSFYDNSQEVSSEETQGKVLEGEEKNEVLREALKEQGYSDEDINVMLGQ